VTVLKSSDPMVLSLAKSVLDKAGIVYAIKGEGIQDLFGMGRIGIGYNPITGPAELQVEKEQKKAAREIIEKLQK